MTEILRITAKRDGFRRAGIAHAGTVDHPAEQFSAAERAALEAEPMLVVYAVTLPEPAPADVGKAGKGG